MGVVEPGQHTQERHVAPLRRIPRRYFALALPIALMALGTNPYLLPGVFDNILYLVSARSIAEHGRYLFGGWPVWDWPPGFPALVSLPVALGADAVLAGKAVVVAAAALALGLLATLLHRERRPAPLLIALLTGLAPVAFLHGTRAMAEWPYMAWAMIALLLLARLHARRGLGLAVLAGLAVGAAALTRHAGVMLGAAVALSAGYQLWRTRRLRDAAPEVVTGLVGGGMFIGWKLHLLPLVERGHAWAAYQDDASMFAAADPLELARHVWELLTHGDTLFRAAGLPPWVAVVTGALCLGMALVGLGFRIRRGGLLPSDLYAIAVLGLCMVIPWKHTRYLFPAAPFVLAWMFEGAGAVASRLGGHAPALARRVGMAVVGVWLAGLIAMDTYVLVRGDGTSYRGLSLLVSPTPEAFYAGEWADLFAVGRWIDEQPGHGTVLMVGRADLKYPAIWSRRPVAPLSEGPDAAAICVSEPPFPVMGGLDLQDEQGRISPPSAWPGAAPSGPRCAVDLVLVQGDAALPKLEGLALEPVHRVGDFAVYAVTGPAR
jgi:hypothetical protein